jgi:excisionase family DNA binding protein
MTNKIINREINTGEINSEKLHNIYYKPVLNREEASIFLGVSIRHIDNLTRRMELPFFKSGSRILFKRSNLDKYIDSNSSERGIA